VAQVSWAGSPSCHPTNSVTWHRFHGLEALPVTQPTVLRGTGFMGWKPFLSPKQQCYVAQVSWAGSPSCHPNNSVKALKET